MNEDMDTTVEGNTVPTSWPQRALQWYAGGRNIVSALLGSLAMFGLMTQVDAEKVTVALDKIAGAFGSIALAIGIIVPIINAVFASRQASKGGHLASVKQMSVSQKSEVAYTLPSAVKAEIAAEAPGIKVVIADPAIAAATPSNKVVEPARAIAILKEEGIK